jgi:hypothetical protein
MLARRTVLAVLALALVVPASAPARQAALPNAPTGLKAFLLNFDESPSRNFSRTPSFAWHPLERALSYEFQLATSSRFRENSVVWSATGLKTPATSVPIALPWVTGKPYSLFARVRAKTQLGTTHWSSSFGFNVRWTQIPAPLPAPNGLLRWTPIDGATGYQIWEVNIGGGATKVHSVATNVTDMRDWFTFHQTLSWVGTASWRVRAIRATYGTAQNGQPSTSYGAWSPIFYTHAIPPSASRITLGSTVSNVIGTVATPAAHALMPGFSWSGDESFSGTPYELYRVYVFSDSDCVQPVLTGSVVGSPSWVPHVSGPLKLPASLEDIAAARNTILEDGDQSGTFDLAHMELTPSETVPSASSDSGGGTTGAEPRLDLWDRAWPSGVYYWTVVPVKFGINAITDALEYQDVELPQDACARGRIGTFGRVSQPIPTGSTTSYVVGLSVAGRVMSSSASRSPRVYGSPLVTWSPPLGADEYKIEWSRTRYPFTKAGSTVTPATSATLPLEPGTWYYRVRGIDLGMPTAAQEMVWSSVRKISVARPVFRIG